MFEQKTYSDFLRKKERRRKSIEIENKKKNHKGKNNKNNYLDNYGY